MTRPVAYLLLLTCAVMWSTGGVLIKSVDWHPLALCSARSAVAALTFLVFLRRPRFTWSRAQLGAAVAYAATVLLFVTGTRSATAGNVILLQFTAPVHVALFAGWFLGERITRVDWLATLVVLVGLFLFFSDELSPAGLFGSLCGLASGVSFAWLALCLRKQKSGSPYESILLGNGMACLVGLPFALSTTPTSDHAFLYILLLGVFQVGLSYILFTKCIRHVSAMDASLIPVLEPLLNPLWVYWIVGETMSGRAVAGGALVVMAVVGRALLSR